MGTPRTYDNLLNTEIKMSAAWLPVTNTFRLGDYGLMSGGVFQQIGHISEFLGEGAVGPHNTRESDQQTSIDLKSEGTKVVRFAAGTEVGSFPAADVEAKMDIGFIHGASFLVKAKLTLKEFNNKAELAQQLKAHERWKAKYRIVGGVYTTENCTVISAKNAGAKIVLDGKASALKALDAGSVEAGVTVSFTKNIGLEIVGDSGVMGLKLFKLRWLRDGIKLLEDDPEARAGAEVEVDDLDDPGDLDDDV